MRADIGESRTFSPRTVDKNMSRARRSGGAGPHALRQHRGHSRVDSRAISGGRDDVDRKRNLTAGRRLSHRCITRRERDVARAHAVAGVSTAPADAVRVAGSVPVRSNRTPMSARDQGDVGLRERANRQKTRQSRSRAAPAAPRRARGPRGGCRRRARSLRNVLLSRRAQCVAPVRLGKAAALHRRPRSPAPRADPTPAVARW